MISKLSLLLRSKMGLAVVGGVLVATVAATTGLAVTAARAHLLVAGQTPTPAQCASDDHNSGPTSSQSDDRDSRDTPGDNQHVVQGTITSIDTANSSFVLTQCDGSTATVDVSPMTKFDNDIHGLAGLKEGLFVDVEGISHSSGSFTASSVHVEPNGSDDDHDGSDGDEQHSSTGGTSTPGIESGD